ncbi:MAG: hypothetical protein WCA19_11845 [Candidatus Acidiferrales bacterium]
MSSYQFIQAHKRRSTRIEQAIPLVVQGVGALREPYQEQVSTLSISCHGCTYQSKHEVIQGETVYLDIQVPNGGSAGCSSKARVKWAQKVGAKERSFQIAVELEIAGNVWGVASPPADWFPLQIPEAVEAAATGRELKVVTRKEQPGITAPETASNRSAQLERGQAASSSIAPLAQLMVGLGQQIQTMASEAAAAAIVEEKSRLLEEFRAQFREEAVKAIQSAMSASKEAVVRQAMKELSEAHEAGARNNYAQWMKKVQQDMESARQHLLMQGKEVGQRLDGMAAGTIERVQRNMETTRTEAVDRFVLRLRDQLAPMLVEAKDSLQKLEITEAAFKKESEAIYAGLENQLEFHANASLAKTQEELDKNSAVVAAKANDALRNLYQSFEKAARANAESLLGSVGSQMTRILQEKATEVSREFSKGLEDYTRSYLESIGKTIAEIPQNMPGRSGH